MSAMDYSEAFCLALRYTDRTEILSVHQLAGLISCICDKKGLQYSDDVVRGVINATRPEVDLKATERSWWDDVSKDWFRFVPGKIAPDGKRYPSVVVPIKRG